MKNDYLDYKQQYTLVEITNHCNLKCPMCPQAYEGGMCEKGFMDEQTFKKIIDTFPRKNKPNALKLFWLGEPMLHPKFAEYLQYAIKRFSNPRGFEYITFDTNGTLLSEKICEVILSAGDIIPIFTISLDAATERAYGRIRMGGNFRMVVKNVLRYLKMRQEREALYPAVMLQFILMEENHEEVLEFIDFWKCQLKTHFVPGARHHQDIIWIKRKDSPDPKEQEHFTEFYLRKLNEYNIFSQDLGYCRIGAEVSNDLRDGSGE